MDSQFTVVSLLPKQKCIYVHSNLPLQIPNLPVQISNLESTDHPCLSSLVFPTWPAPLGEYLNRDLLES